MHLEGAVCILLALGAVCMDLATEKVDNRWICWGWVTGILFQMLSDWRLGFWTFAKGAILPLVLLFPLFVFRMLGPGDIKLFSVLGGLMGCSDLLFCIFYAFLFGAILSLAFLIACGNLTGRVLYFSHYLSEVIQTKRRIPYYFPGRRAENFHFTIPILMGAMLYAGGFY